MANRRNTVVPNGEVIKQLRLNKGHTQESLALEGKIKCSKTTLERLEKGLPTQISTLAAVADAFGVDVKTLRVDNKTEDKTKAETQLQTDLVSKPSTKESSALHLHIPMMEIDQAKNQNLFRYEYRWVPFVGREEEMDRLHRFAEYKNEKLLWWSVTGKGGSGKSRLALELCLMLAKEKWNVGFITNTKQLDSLYYWEPDASTFIVVDDDFNNAQILREYVAHAYKYSTNWEYPVRFLFLEGVGHSLKMTDFCHTDRELIKNNLCFSNITVLNETESLYLEGLDSGHLEPIISKVFAKYHKNPSKDEINLIEHFSDTPDVGRRPLYVIFIADAYARGEDVRKWDANKLYDSLIEYNKTIWHRRGIDQNNKDDQKHINLLLLATMVNKVDITEENYITCLNNSEKELSGADVLPKEHEFQNHKYETLCDNNTSQSLAGIKPDILGEYHIIDSWKGNLSQICKTKLLTKIAWLYSPFNMTSFIARTIYDFAEEEVTNKIISAVEELSLDSKKDFLYLQLLKLYGENGEFIKAARYYNQIVSLQHKYPDKEDIAMASLSASFHLSFYFTLFDDREADKCFSKFAELWNNSFKKDEALQSGLNFALAKEISRQFSIDRLGLIMAFQERFNKLLENDNAKDINVVRAYSKLLLATMWCYGRSQQLNKLCTSYKRIEKVWMKSDRDVFIGEDLGKATGLLVSKYVKAGEVTKAKIFLGKLKDVWSIHANNNSISYDFAGATVNYTYYIGNSNLKEVVECYTWMGSLFLGAQPNKSFQLAMARVAANIITLYSQKGNIDLTANYLQDIKKILNTYRNEDVAAEYVRGILSVIMAHGDNKEYDKAETNYTHLKRIVSEWPDCKPISLIYAKAASSLTFYFSKAGQLNKGTQYYLQVERIAKQNPYDKEILFVLANSLYFLTLGYKDIGHTQESVGYYDNLINIFGISEVYDDELIAELAKIKSLHK